MSEAEIKQVVAVKDANGEMHYFQNKTEANNFLRRPKIAAAMLEATGGNQELADWLVENQDTVEAAFDTGTIKRVTKSDKKKLVKALEALKEIGDAKVEFLIENADAIADSFRWPSVKRLKEDEKEAQASKILTDASNNEDLANWTIANKDVVIAAYKAGKVKREISQKALDGLAAYREKMRKEKEAA